MSDLYFVVMRQLRSIGFIIVVSVLSAITYGGLYSKAPVSNQDTYQPVPAFTGVPASVEARSARQHPGTPLFRYYKRYMEKRTAGVLLLSVPPRLLDPVCTMVRRTFFIPGAVRTTEGICCCPSSRGPPCVFS